MGLDAFFALALYASFVKGIEKVGRSPADI